MPIKIGLKVELPQALREAASRAPQIVVQKLQWAMNASILETVSKVREYITEIGLIESGRLRNSIHGQIVSVNINQAIGEVATSNVIYARIHEFGGTIVPKRAKMLAIPVNQESRMIQAGVGTLREIPGLYVLQRGSVAAGGLLLVSNTNPNLAWRLVHSVYIKEKRYMRTGLERATPGIREFFRVAGQQAMNAIFGKGGE